MIFYFSGTGNSRWVANELAALSGDSVFDMAQAKNRQRTRLFTQTDSLGFVFPVHGWSVPKLVRRFIERTDWNFNTQPYTYAILTCGDDTGCALHVLRSLLHKKKLYLNAAFSVTMPNTYVCLPFFDVDPDNARKKKLGNAMRHIRKIADCTTQRESIIRVHQGIFPHIKTYVIGPLFEKFLITDKNFKWSDNCNGCGSCQKKCPIKNISLSNGHPIWKGTCTMCLACYHSCPRHAIQYGSHTLHKGQYTLYKYKDEITT